MSHGGFGHHGGHHGHQAHHVGHHGGHGDVQILNIELLLAFARNIFTSLLDKDKPASSLKSETDPEAQSHAIENASWDELAAKDTFKYKLMHADLRPLLVMAGFAGVAILWLSALSWLRHHDDPTGKTYTSLSQEDMFRMETRAQPAPAMPPGGDVQAPPAAMDQNQQACNVYGSPAGGPPFSNCQQANAGNAPGLQPRLRVIVDH